MSALQCYSGPKESSGARVGWDTFRKGGQLIWPTPRSNPGICLEVRILCKFLNIFFVIPWKIILFVYFVNIVGILSDKIRVLKKCYINSLQFSTFLAAFWIWPGGRSNQLSTLPKCVPSHSYLFGAGKLARSPLCVLLSTVFYYRRRTWSDLPPPPLAARIGVYEHHLKTVAFLRKRFKKS